MSEQNMPKHGEICWYELTTNDKTKAIGFYQKLFGWTTQKSDNAAMDYDYLGAEGKNFGGAIEMDENWGDPLPPPHWMTYIAVDDIAATVEKVKSNGGNVCVEPFEIPNVGKISVINDPSGATFSIMQFVASEAVN